MIVVSEPDTYHGYNCDGWDLSEGSMLIRGTRTGNYHHYLDWGNVELMFNAF